MDNIPALLAQKADKTDLGGLAPIDSPKFTGTVTVPSKTSAAANNGTLVATEAQVYLKANLASPALTGIPTAPTAAAKINSTQIATTAYADRAGRPVGSYYTQYPATDQSTIGEMFPAGKSPATLFGGTWTERFVGEEVFFKTRPTGDGAEVNRGKTYNNTTKAWSGTGTTGIQEDAMRNFTGTFMANVANAGNIEPSGVFTMIEDSMHRADGSGGWPRKKYNFDPSLSVPVDTRNHPRNRLIKVWERTA
jgi:hypothetical protein